MPLSSLYDDLFEGMDCLCLTQNCFAHAWHRACHTEVCDKYLLNEALDHCKGLTVSHVRDLINKNNGESLQDRRGIKPRITSSHANSYPKFGLPQNLQTQVGMCSAPHFLQ